MARRKVRAISMSTNLPLVLNMSGKSDSGRKETKPMYMRHSYRHSLLGIACMTVLIAVFLVKYTTTKTQSSPSAAPRTLIAAYDSCATPMARFEYVNSLYLANRIEEVRDVSSMRLRRDNGDVGALLLKVECDMKEVRVKDLIETIDRLLPLLEKTDRESLGGKRDEVIRSLSIVKMGAATMTDQQIRSDLEMQRNRNPTPMVYAVELKMLAKDGLF
ncbi:MAG: hypothetical protein WC655_29100 [Candidatus Hydrogenedentales bacterium]